jgi:kynurenine formamidase
MTDINIRGTRIIDLSQAIEPGMPIPKGFPEPQFEMFMSQKEGGIANVEILRFGLHTGTHCDAPYHFFSSLHSVDELPAESLIGPAIVVDMTGKKGSVPIEAKDLQNWERSSGEAISAGDIVLLHTGHSQNWKIGETSSEYWIHGWPYLTDGAADYLASKPIRALGVESFDPDWVNPDDLHSADFPSHRKLLPKGILIIENLTNLDKVPAVRCQVIALPLKLRGCSGSPLRVVAVV